MAEMTGPYAWALGPSGVAANLAIAWGDGGLTVDVLRKYFSTASELKIDSVDSMQSELMIPLDVTIAKYLPFGEYFTLAVSSSDDGSLNCVISIPSRTVNGRPGAVAALADPKQENSVMIASILTANCMVAPPI